MANSKANIYPIQLQNAELNLNKYDAEIKQYRGFNKNNAPFVGGCLSNLFTKDETMAGDTAGTYIDLEGNIWTLDDYGFLKNGEPFGERSEDPLEFWDIEEKQMPAENIIFYYDDDVYVTKEYSNEFTVYTVHIGEYEESISAGTDVFFESFDIVKTSSIYICAYKYYKYSSADGMAKIFVSGVTFDTRHPETGIVPLFLNSSGEDAFSVEFLATWLNYSDIGLYKDDTVWILAPNDCENYSSGGDEGWNTCYIYTLYDRWITTSGNGIGYYTRNSFSQFGNAGSMVYRNLANWHFGKDYAYFFPVQSMTDSSQTSEGLLYPMRVKITTTVGNIYIQLEYDHIRFYPYNTTTYPIHFAKPSINKCILKKYGVLYTLNNFTNSKRYAVGVCDFFTEAITADNTHTYEYSLCSFNTGGLVNSCLLTNNMLPSGLSLPGGFILATEWNSIDKDNLYFSNHFNDSSNVDDNFVIYKDINQNKWFKLFRTTKKKLVNNNGQLVANFNRLKNAIRLQDGVNLTFAPAWNNRYPFLNNYMYNDFRLSNSAYFSSTINEYNLKDNASIILNPIPVGKLTTNLTTTKLLGKQYKMTGINFYKGEDATNCKYFFSAINNAQLNIYNGNKIIFLDENLITDVSQSEYTGFPFPIDSNGNVQYSPSLFSKFFSSFSNDVFVKAGKNAYQLMKSGTESIMSFYLGTLVEGLDAVFVLQGQYYGIVNNQIFSFNFVNGVVQGMTSVVSVQGLQYCGNTPYEALFFSATNRCLYSFTGANLMSVKQFVDKISVVRNYQYNPATQSIFLLTDIGVIVSSLFGVYQIDFDASKIFLLLNGVVFSDNAGNYRYIKYYQDDVADGYTKENINIETCFYGSDNQTVTINDCLYMRLFSENSEAGSIEIAATTISNEGKTTEKTTIKIKSSDWDKETNSIYLRYQPQEQRGLGISFKINSPFKIASLSVGSIPDAILVDKVSKNSINAPMVQSNTNEW